MYKGHTVFQEMGPWREIGIVVGGHCGNLGSKGW